MSQPRTPDGKAIVSLWPTEGSKSTLITPNWCDKRTWYQAATRHVDETPSVVTPLLVYEVASKPVIDTYHGRITGEDFLKDAANNSYRVIVKVDGVAKTEQDPHTATGGDYVIDYTTGRITFLSALSIGAAVTVTYHHSSDSTFVLKPSAGKILKLVSVEAQFAKDVDIKDSVIFQPYGYAGIFAPQLGYPFATLVPLGSPTVYKTLLDYINEANGAYPEIDTIAGVGWRNLLSPILTFPWKYQAVTDLRSSWGMEVRISLQHHEPFGGSVSTASFYCLSVPEE